MIPRCLTCDRELKDPVSIKRKIGPVCWRRWEQWVEVRDIVRKQNPTAFTNPYGSGA